MNVHNSVSAVEHNEPNTSWSLLLILFALTSGSVCSSTSDAVAIVYLRSVFEMFIKVGTRLIVLFIAFLIYRAGEEKVFRISREYRTKDDDVNAVKLNLQEVKPPITPTKLRITRSQSELPTVRETPVSFQKSQSLPPDISSSSAVDMNGCFRLAKNTNFQGFLAANGVNMFLRKAADKAITTHTLTHTGDTLRIQVGGIISSESTYMIGGPSIITKIQDRVFHDSMTYLESGDGVRVYKTSEKESLKYNIEVKRQMSLDRKKMTVTSTAIFQDGKEVQAVQIYERVK